LSIVNIIGAFKLSQFEISFIFSTKFIRRSRHIPNGVMATAMRMTPDISCHATLGTIVTGTKNCHEEKAAASPTAPP